MDLNILDEFSFDRTKTDNNTIEKTISNDIQAISNDTNQNKVKSIELNGEELIIQDDIGLKDNILFPTLICQKCHKSFKADSFRKKLCPQCKLKRVEDYIDNFIRKKLRKTEKNCSNKVSTLEEHIRAVQHARRSSLVSQKKEYQKICKRCNKAFTAIDMRTLYCPNCFSENRSNITETMHRKRALKMQANYHYPGYGPVECRAKTQFERDLIRILQYCGEEFTYQDAVYPLDNGYVFIPRIYIPKNHCYYEVIPVTRMPTIRRYIDKYKDQSDFIPIKILTKLIYNRCVRAFKPYIEDLYTSEEKWGKNNREQKMWKTCPCCGQIFFTTVKSQICVNNEHYFRYFNMQAYGQQEKKEEPMTIIDNDNAKLKNFLNDILRFD